MMVIIIFCCFACSSDVTPACCCPCIFCCKNIITTISNGNMLMLLPIRGSVMGIGSPSGTERSFIHKKCAPFSSTAFIRPWYSEIKIGICNKNGKQPPNGFTLYFLYNSIISLLSFWGLSLCSFFSFWIGSVNIRKHLNIRINRSRIFIRYDPIIQSIHHNIHLIH